MGWVDKLSVCSLSNNQETDLVTARQSKFNHECRRSLVDLFKCHSILITVSDKGWISTHIFIKMLLYRKNVI